MRLSFVSEVHNAAASAVEPKPTGASLFASAPATSSTIRTTDAALDTAAAATSGATPATEAAARWSIAALDTADAAASATATFQCTTPTWHSAAAGSSSQHTAAAAAAACYFDPQTAAIPDDTAIADTRKLLP